MSTVRHPMAMRSSMSGSGPWAYLGCTVHVQHQGVLLGDHTPRFLPRLRLLHVLQEAAHHAVSGHFRRLYLGAREGPRSEAAGPGQQEQPSGHPLGVCVHSHLCAWSEESTQTQTIRSSCPVSSKTTTFASTVAGKTGSAPPLVWLRLGSSSWLPTAGPPYHRTWAGVYIHVCTV